MVSRNVSCSIYGSINFTIRTVWGAVLAVQPTLYSSVAIQVAAVVVLVPSPDCARMHCRLSAVQSGDNG